MSVDPMSNAGSGLFADPLIAGLVTEAISFTVQRVVRATADQARRARKKPDVLEAIEWDAKSFTPSLAGLAGTGEIGLPASTVRGALDSPRGRTLVRQVVAAVVLDEWESNQPGLVKLLAATFESQGAILTDTGSAALLESIHSMASEAFANVDSTPGTAALAQLASRALLLQSTLSSIALDLGALSSTQKRDLTMDKEWLDSYRGQAVRKHGVIVPPDYSKRTTVPIDDIYVPGRLTDQSGSISINVYQAIDLMDRTVILGTPGGGKSTATNAIAHRVARDDDHRVPLVVVLRDFGPTMDAESITEYLERSLSARYEVGQPPSGLIESLLRQGRAFVLLDGLDELLDPSKRKTMAEKVELFSRLYPSTPILVTSRKVGYAEAALDSSVFSSLELDSYSNEDVATYARKWFELHAGDLTLRDGVTVEQVHSAFLEESSSIEDLRSNPLLLALLCIIYKGQNYLPKNRIGIYEKCTELLFETWDRSRGLTYDFSFDAYIDSALKHLAYWMFENDETGAGVAEGPLVEVIAAFFATEAYESETRAYAAAKEFIGFCKDRAWVLTEIGLTSDDEPLFTFVHRTFLEYYAAAQLTRTYPEPEKLALALVKHVAKNEWDTVGQLAVQLMNRAVIRGADKVLKRMMMSANSANRSAVYRANTLMFVVRCLQDLPPSPSLLRFTFPRLASIVADAPDDQEGGFILQLVMGELYELDQSGEYILLSELESFVDLAIAQGEGGRRRALKVTTSCFVDIADDRESTFFRSRFVEDWEYTKGGFEPLKSGYFNGSVDATEAAELSSRAGGLALDFCFYDPGYEAPSSKEGDYQCLAFVLAEFPRIWSSSTVKDLDARYPRWVGSLLRDLAPVIRSTNWPLVSPGLPAKSVRVNFRRATPNPEMLELAGEQLVSHMVVAAALLELVGNAAEIEQFANDLPVFKEADLARRTGSFSESGLFSRLEDEVVRARLGTWAANGGRGLVGAPK